MILLREYMLTAKDVEQKIRRMLKRHVYRVTMVLGDGAAVVLNFAPSPLRDADIRYWSAAYVEKYGVKEVKMYKEKK